MSREILCSTGALIGRPNGRNYKLLKELAPKLHCDGFEFMLYSSWYEKIEELVADLKEMKLHIPVMHCEKHIGEAISKNEPGDMEHAYELFDINCHTARQLGAKKLVIHLWDGITSDRNFENNRKAFRQLKKKATEYELDLLVENVVCNQENPMKHWEELAQDYPDIHFVFDTKMAAFHDQMSLIYEEKYKWLWENGHIQHLHVNDYGGGYMEWSKLRTLPIGKGHVDFERFFRWINAQNYAGDFTVEATAFDSDGNIDIEMLNHCFEYIKKSI